MTRRERELYYQHAHDERVEPHDHLENDMPDPNWGGILIQPNQKKMPVGDPTLWANTITTEIGAPGRAFYSEQIILAQASDRYARSWSLSGSLSLRGEVWASAGQVPSVPDITADNMLMVFLSIVQGIEKISVEQQICLMSGGSNNIGLCNNQSTINGGPYFPIYSDNPYSETSYQARAFAAVGALIGNTISVRAFFVRGTPLMFTQTKQATISLLLTPYAPGAGI